MMARRYRVLVVDDEPSVLLTYQLLLEREGHIVTAAASSVEAKSALAKTRFDLLLCDLSLEEKHSGFEVLEAAREKSSFLPCVLVTGYANVDNAKLAETLGVAVLYKPIEMQELLSTVRTVLREAYEKEKGTGR